MTYASGKMTAQAEPSTCHSSGTNGVAQTTMPPIMSTETRTENQKLDGDCNIHLSTEGVNSKIVAPFHDFWDFLEKVGTFNFLLCRTPGHIVREQMCENSLAQGNTESPKEEEA